ncbi:MAG: protein arginine kinase [Nitrospirae bacterium]|nr:protein arginine kinase [Nitrospirota bacterium]
MKLDDLVYRTSEWLKGQGPSSEIVMSSRVRLARNIDGMTFSHRASREKQAEVVSLVHSAVESSKFLRNSSFFDLSELGPLDCQFLRERHLISHELAESKGVRAVVVSDNEIVSIMINEEDHLRLQAIESGLQLMAAWRLIDGIESELDTQLRFAFSKEWGYLTACPTNAGTGMRASVMLHLPSLVLTKQISKVLQAITKLGLVARGLYGEGTEPLGNYFQISNQVTLGQAEEEIIDNIERVIKQIIGHEENARKILLSKGRRQLLEDKVFRAYGILKNVRIIDSSETVNLLSALRLGVDLGLTEDISRQAINELLIITQPAHLQKLQGRALSPAQRDVKRAELIRERLEKSK